MRIRVSKKPRCFSFSIRAFAFFLLHRQTGDFLKPAYIKGLRAKMEPLFDKKVRKTAPFQFGTADGIRTHDLWLRRPTLYPAELQPHIFVLKALLLYSIPLGISRKI